MEFCRETDEFCETDGETEFCEADELFGPDELTFEVEDEAGETVVTEIFTLADTATDELFVALTHVARLVTTTNTRVKKENEVTEKSKETN